MRARRHGWGPGALASTAWTTSGAILFAAIAGAGACSSDSSDDDDGAGATGAGTTGSGATAPGGAGTGGSGNATQGGSTSVGGGSNGGGGGSVVSVPVCQPACGNVSECNLGTASYDPDNYSCSDGYCHYEGCNSDAECMASAVGDYRCRDGGYGVDLCQVACATVADCDQQSPPFDGDNYDCANDVCVYTGCNSDAECQAIGNYLCRDAGYGMDLCQVACTTSADCPQQTPPYDGDNYACPDGVCVYTGCNSDAECQSLGNYVCR